MHTEHKIHLVPRAGLASAQAKRRQLDPREIVRETLAIMHECSQAFESNELLVDLVTSVIVVRMKKGWRQR